MTTPIDIAAIRTADKSYQRAAATAEDRRSHRNQLIRLGVKHHGLSQADIARALNLTAGRVNQIVNGGNLPASVTGRQIG